MRPADKELTQAVRHYVILAPGVGGAFLGPSPKRAWREGNWRKSSWGSYRLQRSSGKITWAILQ